jgi:hypothetical protein
MTSLRLVGSYEVPVSQEERQWITDKVTGSAAATDVELQDLALLELEVEDETHVFDLSQLLQQGSQQAPWMERYFSADGIRFLGEVKPALTRFRLCFYWHHCDASALIVSPYGTFMPGVRVPMPERLKRFCRYEHPG